MRDNYTSTRKYVEQLQKTPHLSRGANLKLCVVDLLKRGYSLRDVCYELNIKESALSYHVSSLKRAGIIEKRGLGVWSVIKELTPKELQKTSTVARLKYPPKFEVMKEDSIRGHAFVIRFKIKANIRNWHKRGEVLQRHFHDLNPEPMKGGWKIFFKGRKIHLWNESIVIYETKSFLADMASTAKSQAIYELTEVVRALENKLASPNAFSYKGGYRFKVSREHYAMVKNALAKQYRKDGEKLEVYNDQGLWMLIDNSFNLHEWEVHKNRENVAVADSENVQKYWNDHKKTNFEVTPSFIMNAIAQQSKITDGIQQNQMVFDRNMASHLKVLNKIGDRVDDLGGAITTLMTEIKKINKPDTQK